MRLAPLAVLLVAVGPAAGQEPEATPPPAEAAPASPAATPAPGPPPPAADAPRVAGRDVPWPKRIKSVTPAYPAEAQAIGQRGIVIVDAIVGVDGKVESAEVTRSVPPFDLPALEAVKQWEYEVTRVDGLPVRVALTIPITFALKLPAMSRAPGIPELRQGVSPGVPAGTAAARSVRVTARLWLEADGGVREAAVTAGPSPWAEALVQALRTWSFVPPAEGGPISFEVEAIFEPASGSQPPRVDLRLSGLRSEATVTAGAPPPASEAPAPAAPPADPGPPAATSPDISPAGAAPPPAPAAPPPPGPETDVVPAPPPPPPPPRPTDTTATEPGVSAIRDVTLAAGVPDLTSGRRPLVPPLARMEGLTGQVEVRFVIDSSGAASNLELAGPERLKEAARQTVASWTFRRTSAERMFLMATIDYGADTARATVQRQP